MVSYCLTIPRPVLGIVHEYAVRLTAFEFKNSGNQSDKVVVFIGGLTDGLMNVPYLPNLAECLDGIGWTLVQINFSSSYQGWGTGSLMRDADEISQLVAYLRGEKGGSRKKVVLFGHSTGCQDIVQYISKLKPTDPLKQIDGGIIQASISDREAIYMELESQGKGWAELEELNQFAQSYVDEGRSLDVLPKRYSDLFLGAPLNAYRWLSLAKKLGDDDFFSCDLTPEDNQATFGKIDRKLCVLYSEADEYVPSFVDRHKIFEQWRSVTPPEYWSEFSGFIPGALHNIGPGSAPGGVEWALDRTVKFLEQV
ncbi:unnamed protein product [Kuraishia capsulata CBS 1993]|uniref:DUF1749-domain-containing protein n=1 Tax=Kuraishia capsulata CBS 1993 TaxID=1382522 RepID=W6MMS1_9ASCO|nr:uncharacterized protein KUCA_T00002248001 [Kuraishia capsulata CBS 1993]CDK26277.1 unnamed protein product [Kuraishia capsulata CBS 1993]